MEEDDDDLTASMAAQTGSPRHGGAPRGFGDGVRNSPTIRAHPKARRALHVDTNLDAEVGEHFGASSYGRGSPNYRAGDGSGEGEVEEWAQAWRALSQRIAAATTAAAASALDEGVESDVEEYLRNERRRCEGAHAKLVEQFTMKRDSGIERFMPLLLATVEKYDAIFERCAMVNGAEEALTRVGASCARLLFVRVRTCIRICAYVQGDIT